MSDVAHHAAGEGGARVPRSSQHSALRAPGSAAAGGASPAAAGGGGGATAKLARAGGDADTGVEQAGQRCGYPQCGALLTDAQGTPVDGENQEL